MEEKISSRGGASRPPVHPAKIVKSSCIPLPPFRMMFPSTLAKAFENSSYYAANYTIPSTGSSSLNNVGAAGKTRTSIISPPHHHKNGSVDLNMIPPNSPHVVTDLEVEKTTSYESTKMQDMNINTSTTDISIRHDENREMINNHDDVEAEGCSYKGKRVMTLDEAIQHETNGRSLPLEDERKLRRTVSNRLSAQRSRLKRSQHIDELHQKIKDLQDYIASVIPKLESSIEKQKMLKMQKTTLEQRLKNCISKSAMNDREIEEKQGEIRRLKYLYKAQKEEMLKSSSAPPNESDQNNYQRFISLNSATIFQSQPPRGAAVVQLVSTDQGGIEQYINLDALNVSSSYARNMI